MTPLSFRFLGYFLCVVGLGCTSVRAAEAVSVDVGSVTLTPGGSARISVQLRTMGAEVVATQNMIEFADPVRIAARGDGRPDCLVSPGIDKDATGFAFVPFGCGGQACNGIRAAVLAFDNSNPIADGAVLYTCRVTVSADAPSGDYVLVNSDIKASDGQARLLPSRGAHGTVQVRASLLSIEIGDAEAPSGGDALVDVRLAASGHAVVGTQNQIAFAPPLAVAALPSGDPDCSVNPAINREASAFRFLPPGCQGSGCESVIALVLSFEHLDPIPDGATLYTCRITIDADAEAGSHILHNREAAGSDDIGTLLPATGRDGTVTVTADDALVAIDIDDVRAVAGRGGTFAVRLRSIAPDAPAIAGTQNEIVFDQLTPIAAIEDGAPDCVADPEIDKDGTSFLFLPPDCRPGVDCTAVRALVLALDNTEAIPDGSVLYRCTVRVAGTAPVGIYPLRNRNAVAGDAGGSPVAARAGHGQVEVICAGDCDDDGQVAIFEILRGVNILLGNDALATCQTLDADDSGELNVNEMVQAVASALYGCWFAP